MPEITIYTTSRCVQCTLTKNLLRSRGVAFVERNVEKDPEAAEALKAKGYRTAPVVVTPFGDEWAGFQPDRLEAYAKAAKEADRG
jgi:glutaredoxin-like protein NrdH